MATPIKFGINAGTDMDFVLQFDNEVLIIVEIKKKGKYISVKQRETFTSIMDAWRSTGKKGMVLLAYWDTIEEDGTIDFTKTVIAREYNVNKEWVILADRINSVEYINNLGRDYQCPACKF